MTARAARVAPLVSCIVLLACRESPRQSEHARARELVREYGCVSCHAIRDVRGGTGRVGPPLDDVRERVYIAGSIPNTAENLTRWIVDPQALRPGSAMPTTGISERDARLVVAYLLRR